MTQDAGKKFQPYQTASLDSPLFYFLLNKMSIILVPIYQIRWLLARPLQRPLLPTCVPLPKVNSILSGLSYITYGEFTLFLPVIALFLAGWATTFVSPSTEASGYVASYALIAAFLFANKSNSIFSFLFGLDYIRLVPFHKCYSILALVLSFFHGYVAFYYGGDSGDEGGSHDRQLVSKDDGPDRRLSGDSAYSNVGPNPNIWKFLWDGSTNLTGSLTTVCMLGLVFSSLFRVIRKINFDLWLSLHILLSISTIISCILHSVTGILIIMFWWGLDRILRTILMSGGRYPKVAKIQKVAPDLVRITMDSHTGFVYRSGQFVRIAVPEIGMMQFHPITISSSPFEDSITLDIRVNGDWSQRLLELAKTRPENSQIDVMIDGPYGSLAVDLDNQSRYPVVLCFCGGIGVTPIRSIVRQLDHERKLGRKISSIRVVWVVRDRALPKALSFMPDQFETTVEKDDMQVISIEDTESPSNVDRKIKSIVDTDIYITRVMKDEDTEATMSIESDVTKRIANNVYEQCRPDIGTILTETATQANTKGISNIAVLVCGPNSLVHDVKYHCRKQSGRNSVVFDIHDEVFEY